MTTIDWLLDSDPAIRWQVMRDLSREPSGVVEAERSRVAREGWGARLLELQASDGRWGGGTYHPYWTSTHYTLMLLRDLGLDPASEGASDALELVGTKVTWDGVLPDDAAWHGNAFFSGEVDTCINGMVLSLASYFGHVAEALVERLLSEQLDDGGWNCWAGEAFPDETASGSSLNNTVCVLEGLLEYERATDDTGGVVTAARRRGEEMLLDRRLDRPLPSGEEISHGWHQFTFPNRWPSDVLRGLDYLRSAGVTPDARLDGAIELVANQRADDGRWILHDPYQGEYHFTMEQVGDPSRWITLRALRVLEWASGT